MENNAEQELNGGIIDPNLEINPEAYTVEFFGKLATTEKLRETFNNPLVLENGLSVVVDKAEGKIVIGDTHSNMRAGSRANLEKYNILLAKYLPKEGKIEVSDFSGLSARGAGKVEQSVKDIVAQKLQKAIYN
jgi:hypothetical protein